MFRWPFSRSPAPSVDPPLLIETPPVEVRPEPAPPPVLRPSASPTLPPGPALEPMEAGVAWCALFPGSNRLEDLDPSWRPNAEAFVGFLRGIGARPVVTSTRRPPQRAWLMRGAWDVCRLGIEHAPAPRVDLPIRWTEPGALAMVREYGLVAQPSLTSLHIAGLAFDLRVLDWMEPEEELDRIGARYGCFRRVQRDRVHWSQNGT